MTFTSELEKFQYRAIDCKRFKLWHSPCSNCINLHLSTLHHLLVSSVSELLQSDCVQVSLVCCIYYGALHHIKKQYNNTKCLLTLTAHYYIKETNWHMHLSSRVRTRRCLRCNVICLCFLSRLLSKALLPFISYNAKLLVYVAKAVVPI